ncbi:hypothetical protein CDAR_109481 [Caerostris darwini]|uniref:Uncharacterized protein n=1 Tax=Caerostris darwini TaxID=1538125 RepID=A0AAV4TXU3_9ARAC|nr:hypothetical protein CDAR_109481 [Caerostris darwini]
MLEFSSRTLLNIQPQVAGADGFSRFNVIQEAKASCPSALHHFLPHNSVPSAEFGRDKFSHGLEEICNLQMYKEHLLRGRLAKLNPDPLNQKTMFSI